MWITSRTFTGASVEVGCVSELKPVDGGSLAFPLVWQVRIPSATYDAHLAERTKKEAEAGKKLRGRKPKPPVAAEGLKANTSDPESRIMKTKDGWVQGYNAQAMVNEDQVVVGAEVTDEQNDAAQLHPMIEETNKSLAEADISERPGKLLADAGYCSEENLATFDDDAPDPYIATRNTKKMSIPTQSGHLFRSNPDSVPTESGQRSEPIRTRG
jgi:hypothetical protein